jgi:FemAB-related protein (PEP-CTERM system-associated)
MHLALEATTELMFKRLTSQRRAQIRKAEKAGIELRRGGPELLEDFYAVFARNMRDLGTPVYPRRFFLEILRRFPDHAVIVAARVGDRPAGAAFLLRYRDRIEVPWVSTLREFNRVNANTLLYWELLKVAIERGCGTFDFGRSSKGSGTFEFKKQWGAEPVQLYWHYWLAPGTGLPGLTPANPRFALAIRAWQRLPVPVANLLGPLIVKDLP